jgi:hypothetical protein
MQQKRVTILVRGNLRPGRVYHSPYIIAALGLLSIRIDGLCTSPRLLHQHSARRSLASSACPPAIPYRAHRSGCRNRSRQRGSRAIATLRWAWLSRLLYHRAPPMPRGSGLTSDTSASERVGCARRSPASALVASSGHAVPWPEGESALHYPREAHPRGPAPGPPSAGRGAGPCTCHYEFPPIFLLARIVLRHHASTYLQHSGDFCCLGQ